MTGSEATGQEGRAYEEPIPSPCCAEYTCVWYRRDTRQYVTAWYSDRELMADVYDGIADLRCFNCNRAVVLP